MSFDDVLAGFEPFPVFEDLEDRPDLPASARVEEDMSSLPSGRVMASNEPSGAGAQRGTEPAASSAVRASGVLRAASGAPVATFGKLPAAGLAGAAPDGRLQDAVLPGIPVAGPADAEPQGEAGSELKLSDARVSEGGTDDGGIADMGRAPDGERLTVARGEDPPGR